MVRPINAEDFVLMCRINQIHSILHFNPESLHFIPENPHYIQVKQEHGPRKRNIYKGETDLMEKMPLLVLLLYSIPESVILISLSSAIYGYKARENLHRILLLGVTLALVTYIVRGLPVKLGLNALIQIPLFVFLTSRYLKITLVRAFFYILTAFVVLSLTEIISYSAITSLSGVSMQEIKDNVTWRILAGWVPLGIMACTTIILIKKNVSAVSASAFFQPKTRSGKINLLLVGLVLIQAFLSGVVSLALLDRRLNAWPLFDNVSFTGVIVFLLFTFPVLTIFLLKRLFTLSEQEAIAETQEAFIDNIDRLFTTIRGQRHDFINHVQVIYSMLNIGQINEAIKYMDNLLEEIQSISNVIKVKDPVLSALLNTKNAVAERYGVSLEIRLETPLNGLKLKPYETVKVLGNLIDNALEAAAGQPAEFRRVKVNLKRFSFVFVFEVFNPRPILSAQDIKKIFNSGFSTKENHSGLGLALVKDLVERNGGEITVRSSEAEGTVFTATLPAS